MKLFFVVRRLWQWRYCREFVVRGKRLLGIKMSVKYKTEEA